MTAHSPGGRRAALLALPAALLSAALLLVMSGRPAVADTPSSGGDVQVAQTLGARDLTVILRRVTSVPGPLEVDVITHAGTAPGTLALAVIPVGESSAGTSPAPGVVTARAATPTEGGPSWPRR